MRKTKVQEALDAFPEEFDIDEFLERVILLAKIEAGERQIETGQVVPHEEAKKRLEKWLV